MDFYQTFEMTSKGAKTPVISEMRRRQVRDRLREDAELVLREIAFVLKMTQKVKDQMATDTDSTDPLAEALVVV